MSTLTEFKAMLQSENFVVLDTETTGLERGEIVQIAIVERGGTVLLNTLVKPFMPIPADATAIHGISDGTIAEADPPIWSTVRQQVYDILAGRQVVIYNAVYDRKMMHQSSECWGLPKIDWKEIATFWCAMEAFAEHYGDYNEYRQSYRWQKLSTAARHYRIRQIDAHTALDDAETTRQLCLAMAAE